MSDQSPHCDDANDVRDASASTGATGEVPLFDGAVLRWNDKDGDPVAVDARGNVYTWRDFKDGGEVGGSWVRERDQFAIHAEARRRLAARLAALEAELPPLVEAAYREAWQAACEGRTYRKASEDAAWERSRARKRLNERVTK